MITRVCNLLCWGVPESETLNPSSPRNDPVIKYTKDDIDKFEKYLRKTKGQNFLQRFFGYEKKCKNEALHCQNLIYKIALLEHFIACKKFLEDIASLSPNGIRGYLLVDSRVHNKERYASLLDYCQKRALFMLEFKPFRNFLKNYPIMREKSFTKRLKVMRKLKKKLNIFNVDFFNFKNDSEATNVILDYRLIFYNKLAKFCMSYFTLICGYCHIAKPVQLYEIFNDFREVKSLVESINTKFFLLVSNEAIEKLSPVEIDEELILTIERIYQEMGKKEIGEYNEDYVDSLYQKILDEGLKVVKENKILSDRHHFSGLESFLLERITGKARLGKLALNRQLSLSPSKKKRDVKAKEKVSMDKNMVLEMIKKNINKAKESRFSKRRKRFEEKRKEINTNTLDKIIEKKEIEYDQQELEDILKENDSDLRESDDSIDYLSTIKEVSDYSGTIYDLNKKKSKVIHEKNSEEDGD